MPDQIGLPAELIKAARNLEERFQILQVPTRKIAKAEWNPLPDEIKTPIPGWIPILLSEYSLAGGVLESLELDTSERYLRPFRFLIPEEFPSILEVGSLYQYLLNYGLFPFAAEQDGNVWVMRSYDVPMGEIYLYDYSSCDGTEPPAVGDGLVFANSRLDLLLSSMAVSATSYDDSSGGRHYVMWHRAE